MSTLHLKVEDGMFNCHPVTSYESVTEYEFHDERNSWDVEIKGKKIFFRAERPYSTGPAVFKKVLPLRDGTYILGNGNINNRFVAFREKEYADFLYNNGINSVRHINPNGTYSFRDYGYYDCLGNGTKISVKTDGKIIHNYDTDDHTTEVSIEGATYAVFLEYQKGSRMNGTYVTLYTLKDWRELSIPEEWTEKRV